MQDNMQQPADAAAEQHYHEQQAHDHDRAADDQQWPNLAGIIDAEQIETIGSGKYQAAYVNWARTMHMMHTHAPGWLPFAEPATDGGLIHRSPAGCYMMIGFRNMHTQACTPLTPQAVMDHKNKAIPYDSITARDITDTHRRGLCQAAAMFFGLAYELWAKDDVESGYAKQERAKADAAATTQAKNLIAVLEQKNPVRAGEYRNKLTAGEHSAQQIVAWISGELKKYEESEGAE